MHTTHGCPSALLKLMYGGFCFQTRNPDSWEGWYWGGKYVWGDSVVGMPDNDAMLKNTIDSCEMALHWGCDAETTPWGWGSQLPSKMCFFFSEIGIKQVFISPDLNYSGAVHADRWIPINPNTDSALQLAIAYLWIENGWFDQDYVWDKTVGFEWVGHHVYGYDDGIVKTPEWASEITGVPFRVIKALAKSWYKKATTILHFYGASMIRSAFSTEPARLETILLAMQGMGKPGRGQFSIGGWGIMGVPSMTPQPMAECYPNPAMAYRGFAAGDPSVYDLRKSFIPKTLVPEAILGDYTLEER